MIQLFQQGGAVAPYVGYQPVTVTGGSESASAGTAATKASSSSDSSDLTDKDMLKMLKDLDGLPNDMAALTQSLSNFYINSSFQGGGFNTSNIATRYLSALNQMKTIGFYKKSYDEAFDIVKSNGGLNEVAIAGGSLVAMNKDYDIKYIKPSETDKIPEGYQLLTNSQLLSLRANNANLVGNTDIINLVKNGIGMQSVTKMIKDAMTSLGTQESKREGFARTGKDELIAGLKDFQEAQAKSGQYDATADNLYKGSYLTKSQKDAANKSLKYIYSTLPENAKTLLKTKTKNGTTEEAVDLVSTLINSTVDESEHFSLEMDSASAAKVEAKRKETGVKDGTELESNPLLLMQEGAGGSGTTMEVDKGNGIRMTVNGTYYGQIKTADGDPIQNTSLGNMIAQSGIQSMVNNTRNITFGDQKITSEQLNNITYNNTGCVRANLPVKSDGSIDLEILDTYNEAKAELDLLGRNATNADRQRIFKKYKLDQLIKANGELNESRFAPFLVTEGYTTSANGIKDTSFVKEIKDPSEDVLRLIKTSLTTGSGKDKQTPDIDEFNWWNPLDWFGYDKVYKAAVYIPITTNVNASLMGSNKKVDYDESQRLEAQSQTLRKRQNVNTNNSADLLNNE